MGAFVNTRPAHSHRDFFPLILAHTLQIYAQRVKSHFQSFPLSNNYSQLFTIFYCATATSYHPRRQFYFKILQTETMT